MEIWNDCISVYDDFSKFSSTIISVDDKSPVSSMFPHFFPVKSLSAISSLLDVL